MPSIASGRCASRAGTTSAAAGMSGYPSTTSTGVAGTGTMTKVSMLCLP